MIVNMPGTTEIGGDYKVEHRVINCNYLPKSCFQIQSHSKRSGGGDWQNFNLRTWRWGHNSVRITASYSS